MQQDSVESLHSDRESLKEELPLIIGRDISDFCGPNHVFIHSFIHFILFFYTNCKDDSLIGPKVSKTIGLNMYNPYYYC